MAQLVTRWRSSCDWEWPMTRIPPPDDQLCPLCGDALTAVVVTYGDLDDPGSAQS
jgi:hypothetical protein